MGDSRRRSCPPLAKGDRGAFSGQLGVGKHRPRRMGRQRDGRGILGQRRGRRHGDRGMAVRRSARAVPCGPRSRCACVAGRRLGGSNEHGRSLGRACRSGEKKERKRAHRLKRSTTGHERHWNQHSAGRLEESAASEDRRARSPPARATSSSCRRARNGPSGCGSTCCSRDLCTAQASDEYGLRLVTPSSCRQTKRSR